MTKASSHRKRRRERHNASESSQLAITVLRKDFENVEVEGTLLDVSTSGVRLSLAQTLAFHEKIVVKMPMPDGNSNLEAVAEVRWMKHVADTDSWTVGCIFLNQLATDAINEFAIQGFVDRQSNSREPVEQQATAQWQAAEGIYPVTVINSSTQGLCIFTTEEVEIGCKTRLKIDQADGSTLGIMATVKWSRHFDSGYLIGCEAEGSFGSHPPVKVPRGRERLFSTATLFFIFLIAARFYWSNWVT